MLALPSLAELESIAAHIETIVPRTPQFSWPLLNARLGTEVWVKQDNHTAVGSFKIRGALCYVRRLVERESDAQGVIAATRGNYGQSVAFAAQRHGLTATIVVPHGNSPEKNRAMRALGAELIEHGDDFQAALLHSERVAAERRLHWMPAFHPDLAWGNAISALQFLRGAPALDRVYVPIGMGSGICAMIAARAALGSPTRIVGVAADRAPAIALSFAAGKVTPHPASTRIADGMACSTPHPEVLGLVRQHVDRIVRVTDDAVETAMRAYFTDTHNVAEGAGAAALAAALMESGELAGRRIGVMLTGGNVDASVFARVLSA